MAEPALIPEWTLGERMAKARRSAGISSHQMAAILEVSERTVRNWEADRTHPPKAVRAVYHWETTVPLVWIETGGHGDGGGEPSGGDAVTIRYPMLLAVAA